MIATVVVLTLLAAGLVVAVGRACHNFGKYHRPR